MNTVAILAQELNLCYNKKKPTTHHSPLVRSNMKNEYHLPTPRPMLAYAEAICNRAMTIIYICCRQNGMEPDDLINNELFESVVDSFYVEEVAVHNVDDTYEKRVDCNNVRHAITYIVCAIYENLPWEQRALTKLKAHFTEIPDDVTFDESLRWEEIVFNGDFEDVMCVDCEPCCEHRRILRTIDDVIEMGHRRSLMLK
jgi:hypothetical protein